MLRVAAGVAVRPATGQLPQTLADAQDAGWAAPLGVYDRREFLYRPDGEGFLLDSIAGDLIDAGIAKVPASDLSRSRDRGWRLVTLREAPRVTGQWLGEARHSPQGALPPFGRI